MGIITPTVKRQRKLTIDNRTDWDTRALRTVFLKVLNENIKFEGPLKHLIRPKVVYSRGRYSGYAYLRSGTMKLRLPRPTDRCSHCTDGNLYRAVIDGKLVDPTPCEHCNGTNKRPGGPRLNTFKVGWLFEHELAHCRGYQHKGMCSLNDYARATVENYPYLDGITISPRIEKKKPPGDRRRENEARIDARIASWETKLKRASNALKKLRRQKKYYERTADK